MKMDALYNRLSGLETARFYEIASDFCRAFSGIPEEARPPCVTAFLTIEAWLSASLRSGVWTFYEVWDPEKSREVLRYLEEAGDRTLAERFALGLHDYQNEQYSGNYRYPAAWIEEADEIDAFIEAQEEALYAWERALLLENRAVICAAARAGDV